MLIEPSTYVRLIKNCPLDKNYEHTFYFNNVDEQASHFMGMPGVSFSNQSYQRYSKGVLTVQGSMAQLYNCNYMMFKNESFENKWFYAFVKRVEYVNNITCRVYYEIDVMQSWFFDYELGECIILREHTPTDNPGENVVAEHFNIGEYEYEWQNANTPMLYKVNTNSGETVGTFTMEDMSVVIMYDPGLLNLDEIFGEALNFDRYMLGEDFYGGVLQGARFLAIPFDVLSGDVLNTFVGVWHEITDGVIACFCMPRIFLPNSTNGDTKNYYRELDFSINRNTTFGSHTPKNKKLLTYPYTSAYLTANRGNALEFAFEMFNSKNGVATFGAVGSFGATPSAMAFPTNYKGCERYLDGAVSIPSYPICTWTSNDIVEWINNNLFASISATIATASGMPELSNMFRASTTPPPTQLSTNVANAIGPNVAGNRANNGNFIGAIGEFFNDNSDTTVKGFFESVFGERGPSFARGFGITDAVHGVHGGRSIYALVKRIREQDAKIIDAYFTRYGYASNRLGIPNRIARPYWAYVRTKGCKISGHIRGGICYGVPADDCDKITTIYDRGITFWNKNCEIGEYDKYDNSPIPIE